MTERQDGLQILRFTFNWLFVFHISFRYIFKQNAI